jgi:hypothetical protein
MQRTAGSLLAAGAAVLGTVCWIATPVLAFLGLAPEDMIVRIAGAELAAATAGIAPWVLVALSDVAFAAGLFCLAFLFLADWRARWDRGAPERDTEHVALHERLYKDQEELRQQLEQEQVRAAAERDAMTERLRQAEERVAELERQEAERGELMAGLQRMLTRLSEVERREAPRGELHDTARKRLEEIRRGLVSDV